MYGTDGGTVKYASTYSDSLIVNNDGADNHGYTIVTDLASLNSAVSSGATKIYSSFQINYTALGSGYDIRTLAEIIGHCDPSFTLDMYSHSSMESKRKVVTQIKSPYKKR